MRLFCAFFLLLLSAFSVFFHFIYYLIKEKNHAQIITRNYCYYCCESVIKLWFGATNA